MKKIVLLIFGFSGMCLSAQNKINWDIGMNISSNVYGNMHPRIAMDRSGNPMVVWGRMSDGAVMFARWNGSSFATPLKINPSWLSTANASWMGPDIASKGDTVYVVVKRTPETSDTNHIYIISSFNGGVSFLPPVRVDYIADSLSRFPTVAVDVNGNPIVAFMKFNSSFMKSRWVVTKSTDYGKTFSKDVLASGYSGPNSEVCDCCPGALVTAGSTSAMLYRDNLNNIRDIWSGVSSNNNTSFNNGFRVDSTNWMIMSCPSSGPDGVIKGDSLYSVFLSGGSGSYRAYLSKSSLSNRAVSSISRLTGNITGLGQQNYPRIASNGNAMAIVWKQTVNGISQLPILFTNNIKNGFPAGYDTVDLSDNTNTDVAMSNGNIYVIWQDDNSGTVKYRKGTYIPYNANINEIEQDKFIIYPSPSTGTLSIQFKSKTELGEIRVLNMLGETVIVQNISDTISTTLNVDGLANGIYFIQANYNNKYITKKFIKQ